MIRHIKRIVKKKSFLGAVAAVAVTGTIIGTQMNKAPDPVRYVLGSVTRGTLITSIAGSGQVSAENQIDVAPKVSGTLVKTYVALGREVKEGAPLFAIDQKDALKSVRNAQQSVRDAEISLESSQIAYEKLVSPQSNASLLQAQNALNQAERALAKLKEPPDDIAIMNAEAKIRAAEQNAKLAADGKTPKTVRDAYDDEVAALNNIIITMQDSRDDANDVLAIEGAAGNPNFTHLFSVLDQGKKIEAYNSYPRAKDAIESARAAVQALALRDEDVSRIDAAKELVTQALDATEALLDAVKAGLEASLTSSSFSPTSLDQYSTTIRNDVTALRNAYATLRSQEESVANAHDAFDNAQTSLDLAKAELAKLQAGADPDQIAQAEETVAERTQALADVKTGADDIDIKSARNTVAQRQSSLQNARDAVQDAIDTLNEYTVRAPFDGVIASLDAKNANQVSPSTALATILTKAKIAKTSLNEVDVSKVKVGQKATLTFDAVPDLTIAGTVSEVDLVGAASQGVVSYGVKITFLTQDDRIKAGMSVSASIVTDSRTDVLLVPNSAVKQTNEVATVQILATSASDAEAAQGVTSKTPPESKQIEVGLSNDSQTEITSGLNEGDRVVIRTIESGTTRTTTKQSTSRTSSIIPGMGGNAMIMR